MNGIDGYIAKREIFVKVTVSGHVAAATLQPHFDVQRAVSAQGRDVQCGIEHFHVSIALDVAGRHLTRPGLGNSQSLRLVAVEIERHLLQIQYYVGRIFHHASD